MRVLLVVDSFDREFLAMRLTAAALEKRGIVTRLCSRPILSMTYNRFRPDVVVLPKTHKIVGLDVMHRSSVVILAQAESFVGSEDSFKYLSGNLKKEFVDLVSCWGAFDRNFYVENGLFPAERAVVNGHPIIESWYLPNKKTCNTDEPVVGIAMSIRAFTHKSYGLHPNPIACIIGVEEVGGSGYFVPPYHAEDWIAYEAAWIRVIYQLIKENPDTRFSLRPHPLENPRHYKVFERFENLRVDSRGHIAEWLASVDVLCSAFSSSMLDAYFRRIPVVSIRSLIPARILAGIHPSQTGIPHDKHFSKPESFSELRDQLHRHWQPIPQVDDLGQQIFNFPSEKRPSEQLADMVMTQCSSLLATKKPFAPLPESRFEKLCGPFEWASDLRLAMLHFRDVVGGTDRTSAAYGKHRLLENRKYANLFDQLTRI